MTRIFNLIFCAVGLVYFVGWLAPTMTGATPLFWICFFAVLAPALLLMEKLEDRYSARRARAKRESERQRV